MPASDSVTRLLERSRRGDRSALNELVPLVYAELRRIAARSMRSERPDHTLQATALVHEAFVELAGGAAGSWENRAHFFAAAAGVVRRILVRHARARGREKRGGALRRADVDVGSLADGAPDRQVLAVDEALDRLAERDPLKARLVELRFFAGLTVEEAAEVLEVSPRTAARDWKLARAWLSRELAGCFDDAG